MLQILKSDSSENDQGLLPPVLQNISPKYLPPRRESNPCYPESTNGQSQYLIGYGSLLQKASKDSSYPGTGDNVPIRVYGYSRSWTCKGESISLSTTYLGVDADKSGYFNGAFYKVPNTEAIRVYDAREKFYCRHEVVRSNIQLLTNLTSTTRKWELPAGQYWLYVTRPEYREVPSEEYPIVESYVDTFLSGCLELEEKYNLTGFAPECIDTTSDWENPWKNDRIYPRRPFVKFPMAGKVDKLLSDTIPDVYKTIQIEG